MSKTTSKKEKKKNFDKEIVSLNDKPEKGWMPIHQQQPASKIKNSNISSIYSKGKLFFM